MNSYTLVYPNGKTAKIRIDAVLAVNHHIEWGDRFRVTGLTHTLEYQTFDTSITHEVETFVILELV